MYYPIPIGIFLFIVIEWVKFINIPSKVLPARFGKPYEIDNSLHPK